MNVQTKVEAPRLALLREAFPDHQISKLPKESRKQIEERKNRAQGCMVWNCPECGNPHHKDAVHLDYVGHAAATDRLLDTDLEWTWEPLAYTDKGLPAFDENGGLWIKLTVCGVTRLGYGSADGKSGGDAKKEIIGDAIRNAGMRFGMALDLWHKGQLHAEGEDETPHQAPANDEPAPRTKLDGPHSSKTALRAEIVKIIGLVRGATSLEGIDDILRKAKPTIKQAERDWPALLNGDPNIEEDVGLKGAVAIRREELADDGTLKVMIESMKQCDTLKSLTNWMATNESAIEALDDPERRKFELARELHESGIMAVNQVTAGA